MRRNKAALEQAIAKAATKGERAHAHYNLGIFHDNNNREHDAIPHYEKALKLGLKGERIAQCLAWLASSLYKTGKAEEGMKYCRESIRLTRDADFKKWLKRLSGRIGRRMVR